MSWRQSSFELSRPDECQALSRHTFQEIASVTYMYKICGLFVIVQKFKCCGVKSNQEHELRDFDIEGNLS